MKRLKGIGASDGIAVAKVLLIEEQEINVRKETSNASDVEIELVKAAIDQSSKELKQLQTQTLKKLGAEKAAIFEAHQEIVSDPEITNEVITMLKAEQIAAAYAVKTVYDNYYNMFSQMEDHYFRERSADVKDVSERILKHILGIKIIDLTTIDHEVIIVANDLTPSQTAQLDKKFVKGFATNIGGRTSHAAIMARSLEIPAVLGLVNVTEKVKDEQEIALDGNKGNVELELTEKVKQEYKILIDKFIETKELLQKFKDLTSKTADGVDKLIEANIGSPNDVEGVLNNGAEGVGLFRSEFLYMDNDHFPTEEEQFIQYKEVVSQVPHLTVIRTLDIGGDKTLSYFSFPEEMNPFLGYRAIRFTLDKIDIFKQQLRALLRASAFGKLGIMFPMIATIDEFKNAKALVEECKKELTKEKIAYDKNVQVGMMVEIPAAAVNADQFSKYADFFSIGTNDLIQYGMAADRMSEKVSYLYQPLNPAILKLIKLTIDGGHKNNKWVGMCGEMAGDEKALPILLGLGLDAFSMSASSVLRSRALMSKITTSEAQVLANQALECDTSEEVIALVDKFLESK